MHSPQGGNCSETLELSPQDESRRHRSYDLRERAARPVGTCHHATVNIFTRASEITRLVTKVKQPFDPATRARLEDLIIRDHRHHARRR